MRYTVPSTIEGYDGQVSSSDEAALLMELHAKEEARLPLPVCSGALHLLDPLLPL